MVEFNPDGSLKLSDSMLKSRADNLLKMKTQQCIKISRDVVNYSAPKKCMLKITLSEAINDTRFVENIYTDFSRGAKTPTKISKLGPREYAIEVGTDFKRCSECASLRGRYREFLYGNIIEEKGNCTFEGRARTWNDEDYFE